MPSRAPPGRGTELDPGNRFTERELVLDGDERDRELASNEGAPQPTRVFHDASRSVISHNASPDIPFDASLNRSLNRGIVFARFTLTARGLRDSGSEEREREERGGQWPAWSALWCGWCGSIPGCMHRAISAAV